MAQSTKAGRDIDTLRSTVSTISTLITQLQTTARVAHSQAGDKTSNVNALNLAHDTASLIKAHSTKLSLLIINKPFTATAITTVLRELISGPLPGLASAVEVCNGAKYTKVMASELQFRVTKVFAELSSFIKAIPLNGDILSDDQKNGTGAEQGMGSLANTGVVWQACEAVMELKTLGVAGLIIKKAEEYRALLKDALEELHEWGEEDSDGEDEEDDAGENEEFTPQDEVDNIFGSQRHITTDDHEKIRPRLEFTEKRLRLVILMYQAVVKRRLKPLHVLSLPQSEMTPETKEKTSGYPEVISCLDEVLDAMKEIPDITDELASSFYDLDGPEIDKRMDECFLKALDIVELLLMNWEGQKDEFTAWASKFQQAIKKEQ